MIRGSSGAVALALALVSCLVLSTTIAQAAPIDNPGTADFYFYNNPGTPFLAFSSGKSASCYGTAQSWFQADVDSSGIMYFDGETMQFTETTYNVGTNPLYVQLFITDVSGTTDMSSGHSNIHWVISAEAHFKDTPDGITQTTCKTSGFKMSIIGDWAGATSSSFKIPALSGASGACNGYGSAINTALGLGTSGATVELYKFNGDNATSGLALTGS